jgi:hypothetical protein
MLGTISEHGRDPNVTFFFATNSFQKNTRILRNQRRMIINRAEIVVAENLISFVSDNVDDSFTSFYQINLKAVSNITNHLVDSCGLIWLLANDEFRSAEFIIRSR